MKVRPADVLIVLAVLLAVGLLLASCAPAPSGLTFHGVGPTHVEDVVAAAEAALPCPMTFTAEVYWHDKPFDDECCVGGCYGCVEYSDPPRIHVATIRSAAYEPHAAETVFAHELAHLVWRECYGDPVGHTEAFDAWVLAVNAASY